MDALLGLELLDAARGTLLGRAERDGDWTLASRGWDYLPADYRPARRATSPDVRGMIGRLIEDARELVRCRPVAIRVAGRQGDDLLLGGGSDSGLKVGDLQIGRATSELQSLLRTSYAVFCLKKKHYTLIINYEQ